MKPDRDRAKSTAGALGKVQEVFRRLDSPPDARDWAGTRSLPAEFDRHGHVFLTRECASTLAAAAAVLSRDLRYEWLLKPDEAVWLLAARCYMDRRTDQIPQWKQEHRLQPEVRTCYLPVERLKVTEERLVFGHLFLPLTDQRVPETLRGRFAHPQVDAILAVDACGTNLALMAERAQQVANRVLRVLRFSLREHQSIADSQLLFRLGIAYAFDDEGRAGWRRRVDDGMELGMGANLADFVEGTGTSDLVRPPTNDLSRRLDTALGWLERSSFATEPLTSLLYAFFALEAVLGDRSVKLKALDLAFRQALLSHEVRGSFSHPDDTWWLYEDVRSAAVHGENPPELDWKEVTAFRWKVRRSVVEVRQVAQREGFRRRSTLLRFLNEHPDREEFEQWLRAQPGGHWQKWLGTGG